MSFSYDKLWKKLIDEKMNRTDLKLKVGLTSRTIAKMGKNENVSLDTLGKICEYFQCDVGDIIEYKNEQKLEDVRR